MNSVCWQCGKKLMKTFDEIKDHDGFTIRVHKICKKDAEKAIGIKIRNMGEILEEYWKVGHKVDE